MGGDYTASSESVTPETPSYTTRKGDPSWSSLNITSKAALQSVKLVNAGRVAPTLGNPVLYKLIIHPLIRQQLGVRSLLDDLPIVDDHDLVR